MLLSSINLPGDIQRRKTYDDQLNMRKLYVEDDLIVAEIQQFFQSGQISLQTRSQRYGKLENGQFLSIDSSLVKRCKQHFHTFDFGVQLILGNNGYIWISCEDKEKKIKNARELIVRVKNSIIALSNQFIPVYPDTILDVFEESKYLEMKDILLPENSKVTLKALERVQQII